jgi:hypothetical protein
MFGWFLLGCLFFAYAVPTFIISVLANLGSFKSVVPFLGDWEDKSKWSFRLVSGTLGPVIQAIFLFILPIFIRRICKRQGAQTRSRLDRASTARYYFIMTIWTLFFLTIFGTVYQTILQIIEKVNEHMSFSDIMSELSNDLPLREW